MDIEAYIQSGIIESYVLGLASAEEIAEVEKMRLQYAEVEKAINDFSASIEQELLTNEPPPPGIKIKLMEAIKAEQRLSSNKNIGDSNGQGTSRVIDIRPAKLLAAASIILFLVSAGLNFYFYNRLHKRNQDYQALLSERNGLYANNQIFQTSLKHWESSAQMMADPAMAVVKMTGRGMPGKEENMATLFWDTRNKNVYIMPNKLPKPISGKQYQLWALIDGKPVDAGMLDNDCTGACKMKNIPKAQGFAITLEKAGGSPTPTLQEMYAKGGV